MLKKRSDYINSLIALAAMSACFLFLLNRTWMKWGDLIVDTFREFWIPMKLLDGHILYRDVFYEYGFFPPYFQALLFKLFGVHEHTLVGLGVVITILTAAALYLISRLFLDRVVSVLTVIIFFLVFAFGHYTGNNNFNFILPYSFASTLFFLFTLYAVFFFLRFIQSGRQAMLNGWAACLSMALFCRVDQPLLVWTGFMFTGGLLAVKNPGQRRLRLWLTLASPVIAGIIGYGLFICHFDAWSGFKESVIGPALFMKDDSFQKMVMGTENVFKSLKIICKSSLLTLVLFSLLGLCAAGIARFFKSGATALPFLPAGIAGLALIFLFTPALLYGIQYRCLPLFLAVGIFYYGRKFLKNADGYHLQLFCLFLVALLLAFRVLLKNGPGLYGFYLVVVGLVCYHLIVFKVIGDFLLCRLPVTPRPLLYAVFIGFLIFPAVDYGTWANAYYQKRTAKMITEKGTFIWPDNVQTRTVHETIAWLRHNTRPEATVAVFPEGIGINFFSDRENPLKYCNFMPPVLQYIGYDKLVEDLSANNVDYVVIIGRNASDYGHPFFGVDYGKRLMNWIQQHYHLKQVIGAIPFESKGFGVAIYRKNT